MLLGWEGAVVARGRSELAGDSAHVRGELTIKGVARPLAASGTLRGPVTDGHGRERFGLTLITGIDRTDFAIKLEHPLPSRKRCWQTRSRS